VKQVMVAVLALLLAVSEGICQQAKPVPFVQPTDQQVAELAVRIIRQYIASDNIITPGSSPWREAAKRYLPLLINGEYGVLLSKFLIIGEGMRPKSEPGGVVIHGELIILARELRQLRPDISLPPWIILLLEQPIV